MIGLVIKTKDETGKVKKKVKPGIIRSLKGTAAYLRAVARNSIKKATKKANKAYVAKASAEGWQRERFAPSAPGTPPNTHYGALKKAIEFEADSRDSFYVGPRKSDVENVGHLMERGGKRWGRKYPARPFMRPALEKSLPRMRADFKSLLK